MHDFKVVSHFKIMIWHMFITWDYWICVFGEFYFWMGMDMVTVSGG